MKTTAIKKQSILNRNKKKTVRKIISQKKVKQK